MPKISVVMSVYNGEKYLKDSIESILNQTYRHFEFIIIDDGSTDKSLSILNAYVKKDNRIIIISRENRGLAYSLNEGVKLAKGKYIARMDVDDISDKFRLENQLEYLEENEDVDILGSFVEIFGSDIQEDFLKIENWFNIKFNCRDIKNILLKSGCCIAHSSVMLKKDIFKILIAYEEKYLCEDYNLWLRALKKGLKIEKIEKKLLKVRRTKNSLSKLGNAGFNMIRDIYLNKLNYVDLCKDTIINKYIIWGASNGGKIAEEIIGEKFPSAKCVGYVDSFKEGDINSIQIFKPLDLTNLEYDYIFIATSNGRDVADEFLKRKLKLMPIKDFFWLA